MTEAEWLACADPMALFRATQDRATRRQDRLFYAGCARLLVRAIEPCCYRTLDAAEILSDCPSASDALKSLAGEAWDHVFSLETEHPPDLHWHTAQLVSSAADWSEDGIDHVLDLCEQPQSPSDSIAIVCLSLRCVFGNPFRPVTLSPSWLTSTVVAIARGMYDARDFSAMPILADALQDAGCENADVLAHCRGLGPHVRGCWVVDGVLG